MGGFLWSIYIFCLHSKVLENFIDKFCLILLYFDYSVCAALSWNGCVLQMRLTEDCILESPRGNLWLIESFATLYMYMYPELCICTYIYKTCICVYCLFYIFIHTTPSSSCLKSIMKSIKFTITWKMQGWMRAFCKSCSSERLLRWRIRRKIRTLVFLKSKRYFLLNIFGNWKIEVKMFLDRMFSYTFSSMPLYFSEKLTSIQTDLPQFSLRSPRGDSVLSSEGDSRSHGFMYHVSEIGC